jgi:prepilin-type N-terminal cleavage/methylation domain-containing protein
MRRSADSSILAPRRRAQLGGMHRTRGFTLVELLFALLLVGMTSASLAPVARRQRDRALVIGAREAVVGLFAEARVAAMESGAASVRITTDPARAEAVGASGVLRSAAIAEDFGVRISIGGPAAVELSYDGLGLGRMTSQTITFTRGDETTDLVVSGHGRVRRR